MKFTVTRGRHALYGILGQIKSEDGALLLCTLEHAYAEGADWVPKLAAGTYEFKKRKSPHLGYVVWALEKAPDFQGAPVSWIEIHIGNYNKDSIGCTLLGLAFGTGMIEDSRKAFEQFMEFTKDQESITVTYV